MDYDIVIQTSKLSRKYRRIKKSEGLGSGLKNLFSRTTSVVSALVDFDLELLRGEFIGLIGPNGAGKTTLIKLLSGLMEPSSGTISVLGYRPTERKEGFLSRIALVMGQKSQLWWDLPAIDSFRLNKAMYGLDEQRYRTSLQRLCTELDAEKLLDSPVRTLSLGERMRMELIGALLHEPELLFLDEPTIGLDAPSQKKMRDFLQREHRTRNLSMILTSHYMEDIRKLCSRSILIHGGVKRYDGPTESMLDSVREHADEPMEDIIEKLYALPGNLQGLCDES